MTRRVLAHPHYSQCSVLVSLPMIYCAAESSKLLGIKLPGFAAKEAAGADPPARKPSARPWSGTRSRPNLGTAPRRGTANQTRGVSFQPIRLEKPLQLSYVTLAAQACTMGVQRSKPKKQSPEVCHFAWFEAMVYIGPFIRYLTIRRCCPSTCDPKEWAFGGGEGEGTAGSP